MSSKKVIALVLCLVLTMWCAMPAAASEESSAVAYDLEAPSCENALDEEAYPSQDVAAAVNNKVEKLAENLELESEIPQLASGIMVMEDNQAPVANPQLVYLNEESMHGDQFTTDTIFFLFTRVNGTDLVYDPDGGVTTPVWNSSFPSAYRRYYEDPAGDYAGFFIHIFNEGTFTFGVAFLDGEGASSEASFFRVSITHRGVYDIIEDTLPTASDTNTHQLTVNFDSTSSYSLGVERLGSYGVSVKVINEDGTTNKSTYVTNPSPSQRIRDAITLTKPEGVSGEYTFTVEVTGYGNTSTIGASNIPYKLVFGATSQKPYFFEGAANAVNLPYYHTARSTTKAEPHYTCMSPTSELGEYYIINTIGTEVVTLRSRYGAYRFKILDMQSMETLFDGANLSIFSDPDLDSYKSIRADINFGSGQSYYLVIYKIPGGNDAGFHSITVGEPQVTMGQSIVNLPSGNVVKGQTYTLAADITTPTGNPAYTDYVYYRCSGAGWPIEGGYVEICPPGTSEWIRSAYHDGEFKFNYQQLGSPLYRADGQWKVRFKADESGSYNSTRLTVRYYYEL